MALDPSSTFAQYSHLQFESETKFDDFVPAGFNVANFWNDICSFKYISSYRTFPLLLRRGCVKGD